MTRNFTEPHLNHPAPNTGHNNNRGPSGAPSRDDGRHRQQPAAPAQEQDLLPLAAEDQRLWKAAGHLL